MVKLIKEDSARRGYDFIPPEYLQPGEDEYIFRFARNPRQDFRPLTSQEIDRLRENGNGAGNWSDVLVADPFNPDLIRNSRFEGLVRIGCLEEGQLTYHDLSLPCGIYGSLIISSDLGDHTALHNVRYLSHYIVGNRSILFNIDEMSTTNHSKFGNGIVKEGEEESVRIAVEVANENGARKIFPFEGMLPGDGWLWSKFRNRPVFQESFRRWTEERISPRRGFYGEVGEESIIKSCRIIKDVLFGESSYVKGANKLKNLTLGGTKEQPVQIGEGVELVNGIVHRGARIFYGVKAVRFILGEESQLKYGARLINSFLGANSTISCCEVLNALIFPFHEQHHNNSFLIASVLQGQTNMAAGATVGSNHNSRGSDGEIVASRGFWPGLNTSLKHNSRFAPYTLISKGAYPAELDIPLPFSLLSNDESRGMLTVMPAYWFHYNMYAMARNSWKYARRDKRREEHQKLEFHYLAPDSMEAVMKARRLLEEWCGKEDLNDPSRDREDIVLQKHSLEKGRRPARILYPARAWRTYGRLVEYYFALNLLDYPRKDIGIDGYRDLIKGCRRETWYNAGGQLVPLGWIDRLEEDMEAERIDSWDALHGLYRTWGEAYPLEKLRHSAACWFEMTGKDDLTEEELNGLIRGALATAEDLLHVTRQSREKDYTQKFRLITFDTPEERDAVLGKLEEDSFIKGQEEELSALTVACEEFLKTIGSH